MPNISMDIEFHSHTGGPEKARKMLYEYPKKDELASHEAPITLVENLGLETSLR
jgi:hypothetical protein